MSTGQADRQTANMEIVVGYVLLAGVVLSALLLMAGMAWRWVNTGHPELAYTLSGSNLFEFWKTDIQQITALAFRPRLLVNLGIGVLMVTPYLRVIASMLYFGLVERNIKYALFTGFVFAVLTYSLFLR